MRQVPEDPAPECLKMLSLPARKELHAVFWDAKKHKIKRKHSQRRRPHIPSHEQDAVAGVIKRLHEAFLAHRHRFLMVDKGPWLVVDAVSLAPDLLAPVQFLIIQEIAFRHFPYFLH